MSMPAALAWPKETSRLTKAGRIFLRTLPFKDPNTCGLVRCVVLGAVGLNTIRCDQMNCTRRSCWTGRRLVVLFEFQTSQQKHFHLEQPDGSLMLELPVLSPIFAVAQACRFDLCEIGNLCEPVTQRPIRKRLIAHSTSPALRAVLQNRWRGNHEHVHVAGSTYVGNQRAHSQGIPSSIPENSLGKSSVLLRDQRPGVLEPPKRKSIPQQKENDWDSRVHHWKSCYEIHK